MRTYLISYDLAAPARNKHAVAAAIMSLGSSWARPLEQTWYLRSTDCEGDLRDRLSELLSEYDGLLVQSVSEEAALSNTQLRWFRQRQPQLELRVGEIAAASDAEVGTSNIFAFPPLPEAANQDAVVYARAS